MNSRTQHYRRNERMNGACKGDGEEMGRRGSWNSQKELVLRERSWSTVTCFREFRKDKKLVWQLEATLILGKASGFSEVMSQESILHWG